MNKRLFNPPFMVQCKNENEYQALRAVVEADGWPAYANHKGFYGSGGYGVPRGGLFQSISAPYPTIKLQDALFRGAPDWATGICISDDGTVFWKGKFREGVVDQMMPVGSGNSWLLTPLIHITVATRELSTAASSTNCTIPDRPQWPKAGDECLISYRGEGFRWCKIRFMGNSLCVIDDNDVSEQHHYLRYVEFRPIQSDRDQFIGKAYEIADLSTSWKKSLGKLYDAGARFNESN